MHTTIEPHTDTALIEAITIQYKLELAKMEMLLVKYRQLLIDNDIEPPDASCEELLNMMNQCKHVISTANQFVISLGTAKEMLVNWT